MARQPDADVDRLYQLPLEEFTPARNALAKSAGKDGGAIRQLAKPHLAAWGINQLYWRAASRYQALVDAALELRRAHKAVLEGKDADLRAAGRAHDAALHDALDATLGIMKQDGQPVTGATRQAILNTLRALPADDPPGRLTRPLAPGGFEMLAGISTAPAAPRRSARTAAKPAAPKQTQKRTAKEDAEERAAAKAREQREALERSVRDADQRARHAEFEAARTARAAAKAESRLEAAREAVEAAQRELGAAEEEAAAALQAKKTADREVRAARAALETVQRRAGRAIQ